MLATAFVLLCTLAFCGAEASVQSSTKAVASMALV